MLFLNNKNPSKFQTAVIYIQYCVYNVYNILYNVHMYVIQYTLYKQALLSSDTFSRSTDGLCNSQKKLKRI